MITKRIIQIELVKEKLKFFSKHHEELYTNSDPSLDEINEFFRPNTHSKIDKII